MEVHQHRPREDLVRGRFDENQSIPPDGAEAVGGVIGGELEDGGSACGNEEDTRGARGARGEDGLELCARDRAVVVLDLSLERVVSLKDFLEKLFKGRA